MGADEYIFFEEWPRGKGLKTRLVVVRNRRSADELGEIKWYAPWRQYCFFPISGTIFNPVCMARITREVTDMQVAHKEAR